MNVRRLELAFGCCSVYVAMVEEEEEEEEENQKVQELLRGCWRPNTRLAKPMPRGGPRRPDTYAQRRHQGVRVKIHSGKLRPFLVMTSPVALNGSHPSLSR